MTEKVTYRLPPASAPANHGHTSAAWVLLVVVVLGLIISSVGFVMDHMSLVYAGIVVMVLGVIGSGIMRRLGKGQPLDQAKPADWYDA